MKKFFLFFISKKFLLNIVAIFVVWAIVIFSTSSYISSHTNYGEKIEVPNFYKIHMDDIDQFVSGKKIKYEIIDSVYMEDWPKGTVCWQHPKPTDSTGEFVKRDRIIQLSIVPMYPKMILVPNVIDKSKRIAESQLESLGLRTKITYKPSAIGSDYVIDVMYNGKPIPKGTSVPKGSLIELYVARGGNGEVTALPELTGLTIKQAKQRLSNLTLTLHPECDNCSTPEDFENAVIFKQSPIGGEGATVAAGTTVTVWASK